MSESGMSESGTGSTISSSVFASDYDIETFAHERVYQYCESAYTAGTGSGIGGAGALSDAALDEVSGEASQTMQRLEAAMSMPRRGETRVESAWFQLSQLEIEATACTFAF